MRRTPIFRNIFKNLSISKPPPISSHVKRPILVQKSKLELSDLKKLFHHEITALQIKSFYPPAHAGIIAKELDQKAKEGKMDNWRVGTERGLEASDVWTEGEYVPYNVAVAMNKEKEYFDGVEKDFRNRRMVPESEGNAGSQPRLWPLDLLRLELDEVWMDGAGLARNNDKRVQGGGLPRIMMGPTRWKQGFIHADQFSPLSTTEGLFSGNIYLQLPDSSSRDTASGDLQIWNLEISSQVDWYRYQSLLKGLTAQDAGLQMKLRKELGDPLKIHVEAGDLVMLCVQKPHCAVGFMNGTRISLQCFVQYRTNERLLVDI
jgi:hypothetical protein